MVAVLAGGALGVSPASADSTRISDDSSDVTRYESETFAFEPRVDITSVEVSHEVAELRVAVAVSEFTPIDDDVWVEGNLGLGIFLVDPDTDDPFGGGFWIIGFGSDGFGGVAASMISFSEDDLIDCPVAASTNALLRQYVVTVGVECLQDVPRAVQVGVEMTFDPDWDDDDYDTPWDGAPDLGMSEPIVASGPGTVIRLAGADRVETAIALSVDRFDDAVAPAAVLASTGSTVDAVIGGPLAAAKGGALLLTGGASLDPRVAAELDRSVAPGSDVFLLGGTGALSDAIAASLRERGFRPRRIAGPDRYATSVAVAREIGDHAITVIASGRSAREGLIAAAAAASLGGVVVLSDGGVLPKVTSDYLAEDAVRHVAIGAAADASPGAERITAASASELSQKVLDRLLPTASAIAIASQDGFADALAGAPHIAARRGGLLLTSGTELSAAPKAELTQRKAGLRQVLVYGGTASLSAKVAEQITAALR